MYSTLAYIKVGRKERQPRQTITPKNESHPMCMYRYMYTVLCTSSQCVWYVWSCLGPLCQELLVESGLLVLRGVMSDCSDGVPSVER